MQLKLTVENELLPDRYSNATNTAIWNDTIVYKLLEYFKRTGLRFSYRIDIKPKNHISAELWFERLKYW